MWKWLMRVLSGKEPLANTKSLRIEHLVDRQTQTVEEGGVGVQVGGDLVQPKPSSGGKGAPYMTPISSLSTQRSRSLEELGIRASRGPIDSEATRRSIERFRQTQALSDSVRQAALEHIKRSSTFNPVPPSNSVFNATPHVTPVPGSRAAQIQAAANAAARDQADWARIRAEQDRQDALRRALTKAAEMNAATSRGVAAVRQDQEDYRRRQEEELTRRRRDDDDATTRSLMFSNTNNTVDNSPAPAYHPPVHHDPAPCPAPYYHQDNSSNRHPSCPTPSYDNGGSNWGGADPSPSNND
jgi:hypothetical protein